jgi:predicted secreted hydrolase
MKAIKKYINSIFLAIVFAVFASSQTLAFNVHNLFPGQLAQTELIAILYDPPLPGNHPRKPARLADQPADYARFGIPVEPGVVDEDMLRTDPNETSYEWWYIDGHFTDGSSVVVGFYTKQVFDPVHIGTKPGVLINMAKPSGEIIQEQFSLSAGEGSFSSTACDVTIRDCTFREVSDGVFEIKAQVDTLAVDLTLTRTVPTWRPATGHLLFDESDYFAWLVEVPKGEIEGTVTYEGQTINVSGSGYHDHNWGNASIAGLFKYWWWSRVEVEDYTIISAAIRLKHIYEPEWIRYIGVMDTGGAVIDGADLDVDVSHQISDFQTNPDPLNNPNGAYPYTLEYNLVGTNGDYCDLTIDSVELLVSNCPLGPALGVDTIIIKILQMFGITPWYTSMTVESHFEFNWDGISYSGDGTTGTKELMDLDGNNLESGRPCFISTL